MFSRRRPHKKVLVVLTDETSRFFGRKSNKGFRTFDALSEDWKEIKAFDAILKIVATIGEDW